MVRRAFTIGCFFFWVAAAAASDWRFERDGDREVRIVRSSANSPADLVLACAMRSGLFEWWIANLPPHPASGGVSMGMMDVGTGVLNHTARFPYVRFETRLSSPRTDRAYSGLSFVRLQDGSGAITLSNGSAVIRLPGPALDAYALLGHARAAEANSAALRVGRYQFDVTGVDAAMARLGEACVGPEINAPSARP